MQLSSCKGGGDPIEQTEEEIFLTKITGIWNTSVAQVDGKDVTKSFPGMVVTITDAKGITVTNPVSPMWKAASTFTLEPSGSSFTVKRNDGLVISVPEVTTTKIVLAFQYDPAVITGRLESVKGQFRFEFTK